MVDEGRSSGRRWRRAVRYRCRTCPPPPGGKAGSPLSRFVRARSSATSPARPRRRGRTPDATRPPRPRTARMPQPATETTEAISVRRITATQPQGYQDRLPRRHRRARKLKLGFTSQATAQIGALLDSSTPVRHTRPPGPEHRADRHPVAPPCCAPKFDGTGRGRQDRQRAMNSVMLVRAERRRAHHHNLPLIAEGFEEPCAPARPADARRQPGAGRRAHHLRSGAVDAHHGHALAAQAAATLRRRCCPGRRATTATNQRERQLLMSRQAAGASTPPSRSRGSHACRPARPTTLDRRTRRTPPRPPLAALAGRRAGPLPSSCRCAPKAALLRVTGLVLEAAGVRAVGSVCEAAAAGQRPVLAEVVRYDSDHSSSCPRRTPWPDQRPRAPARAPKVRRAFGADRRPWRRRKTWPAPGDQQRLLAASFTSPVRRPPGPAGRRERRPMAPRHSGRGGPRPGAPTPLATGVRAIDALLTVRPRPAHRPVRRLRRRQERAAGHDGPLHRGRRDRHRPDRRARPRGEANSSRTILGAEGLARAWSWWPPADSRR